MMPFKKEQVFIVTGASSGIGRSVALHLNKLGATVIAVARNEEQLSQLKTEASQPENVFIEIRDLAKDIEGLPSFVTELRKKFGKLSGVVYAAGVVEEKPLQLLELDEMKRLFDINYFAPIFMMKGFADRRNNVGNGAAAVFVSGMAIVAPNRAQSTYAGSKAALSTSMRSIAKEVSSFGVRVNCVLPSDIKTPMTDNSLGREERLSHYPFGFGETEDVAEMVSFLLSEKSKWITAQNYIIDCGSV